MQWFSLYIGLQDLAHPNRLEHVLPGTAYTGADEIHRCLQMSINFIPTDPTPFVHLYTNSAFGPFTTRSLLWGRNNQIQFRQSTGCLSTQSKDELSNSDPFAMTSVRSTKHMRHSTPSEHEDPARGHGHGLARFTHTKLSILRAFWPALNCKVKFGTRFFRTAETVCHKIISLQIKRYEDAIL